jgi:SAM-dependent methyltransferase
MIQILQSREQLEQSRERLRARNLDFTDPARARFWRMVYRVRYRTPLPPADFIKSWDVCSAVEIIERHQPDRRTPILDMGCFNSEILYALHALGYRRLHGCDLNPMCRWMPYRHRIRYRLADLTATPYPDHHFGAITSISVIEHGVPIEPLVREVARLLRPGGIFLFTTDYDASGESHEVSEDFRVFGQSWTIYEPATLAGVVERFQAEGFTLLDPEKGAGEHRERPISWNGQEYTFALVTLRAPGG